MLGGGVITQATATLTVIGLTGTLTAGSGYTESNYNNIKVRNNPTSTLAVTNADRAYIPFRYSDNDDQAYEVSTTGGSNTDYTFTRTSSVGTASGDDISFAVEKAFSVNDLTSAPFLVFLLTNFPVAFSIVTPSIIASKSSDFRPLNLS